ncbi:MAG: hypothetical protein H5T84_00730, partial [Thermoleophilia bacterium]|nr:hypothetical protein [Thermoleophilia bacterium]
MAWTAPVDFVAGAQLNAEQLNLIQDNLRALKAPPSQQILRSNGGSYTTNSTTPVKVDSANLSITLQTAGGDVLVWFSGAVSLSTVGYV